MKKIILYAGFLCLGLASCSLTDEEEARNDMEKDLPAWLGESVYAELKNPKMLKGTFNTYSRLIEDLDYATVLGKTGSKTIFPANDEAFAAFFADPHNVFGKSSYEQLTNSEKAQLLFSSMLDNAIVSGDLSVNSERKKGILIKHPTNLSNVYSVSPLYSQNMPANNPYFAEWKNNGQSINALYDNTDVQMVHLTSEYFLQNGMTVAGADNDFKVITGQDYKEGDLYIYDNKVYKNYSENLEDSVAGNVTCQNGYIHQVSKVLTNPGNMAQILRANSDTRHISRMLDYFAVPVDMDDPDRGEPGFMTNYREYMKDYGTQEKVYAIRYLSKNSQKKLFNTPVKGKIVKDTELLNFDPGWNDYVAGTSANATSQTDIAAILAPTDEVIEKYFSGPGAYIVKNLGVPGLPCDKDHIKSTIGQHLDAIYNSDPAVVASMLNNILKPYLTKTVPSTFATVQNDAFEFLGVKKSDINMKDDGRYNVQIANNGVIYKMDTFFSPELYNSVLGPASVYTDMRIMGNMLQDHQVTPGTPSELGADMYYYLLSMKAKYALFIPTDNSFFFYIDPASKYDVDENNNPQLKALFFNKTTNPTYKFGISVDRYYYDEASNTFTPDPNVKDVPIESGMFNTQIQDMLNYHTVVLEGTSGLNGNHYYLTKHGGAIFVPDGKGNKIGSSTVMGGAQIGSDIPASVVTETFSEGSDDASIKNGTVYRLNMPIQPTMKSVYDIMEETPSFKPFQEYCSQFSDPQFEEMLYAIGILGTNDSEAVKAQKLKQWQVFGENNIVNYLSAYNYTIYVPTNMDEAYSHGLPTWTEVNNLYAEYSALADTDADKKKKKTELTNKLTKMRDFIRYHIQNNSVFDDEKVPASKFYTFKTDELGIAQSLTLQKNGGSVYVKDAVETGRAEGPKIVISNRVCRDVVVSEPKSASVNGKPVTYKDIVSSSFVVVHGIDKPLFYNKDYSKSY